MARQRQDQLLQALLRADAWSTAAELADILGVTPRSVRSYVAALNARTVSRDAVESGPAGYRAGQGAHESLRARTSTDTAPRDRVYALIRELLTHEEGIDVHDVAARMHVSDTTVEADLTRVRGLLDEADLTLERERSRVRLRGTEVAQRRVLSRLAHDEMDTGSFHPESIRRALAGTTVNAHAVGPFKSALVRELGELGYFVNELAISDVLLHIAIAADRVASGRPLESRANETWDEIPRLGTIISRLANAHFGVALGTGDSAHLATLVLTRAVAPDQDSTSDAVRRGVDHRIEAAVRAEVVAAANDYQIDLVDDTFILRLALHVQNLLRRAQEQAWVRNPLTRSLKSTYPMIFDVAVSIVSGLHDRLGAPIHDDEIAYIAMHIGGRLERSRKSDMILSATIVCPGYYELHELLRSSVDRSLGSSLEVTNVVTTVDPDWSLIDTDLVLTTIDPGTTHERFVRIQPFLTDADIDRISASAARLRRARRLTRLREELDRYLVADAFVSPLPDESDEAIIRRLGGLLVDAGIITDEYIENTIARERMSSTAFTDALAVPHALHMTATRTAIAIGVADGSVVWGDGRVQVVVFAAFSGSDRTAFQTVFEQLVEVFSERESVQRILRRAQTFEGLLDELVAVIDG